MHLITTAHMGEAQSIIELFNLQKKDHSLFVGEDLLLLITGEGPFEASTKVALILGSYPITEIINLGVAGSLSEDYGIEEILPIRTSYIAIDLKPGFKTFQLGDEGVDCITSFERILEKDKAQKLRGVAHLVDRELWGVAISAKTAGISLKAYKIVSDMAGTMEACEVVKDHAENLSLKLALFLKKLLKQEIEAPEQEILLPGFHFTFTMKHRLESLLKKLSLKLGLTTPELLKTLPSESDYPDTKPKERARLFLLHLEDLLDPTRKILQLKKEQWLSPLKNSGIKVQTDPIWEDEKVNFSFDVQNNEELQEKIRILSHFSLTPYQRILQGELDVE